MNIAHVLAGACRRVRVGQSEARLFFSVCGRLCGGRKKLEM